MKTLAQFRDGIFAMKVDANVGALSLRVQVRIAFYNITLGFRPGGEFD